MQQKFQDLQSRGFEAAISVYGETARLPKDQARVSDAQLDDAARAIGKALATVDGLQGVAQALAAIMPNFSNTVSTAYLSIGR